MIGKEGFNGFKLKESHLITKYFVKVYHSAKIFDEDSSKPEGFPFLIGLSYFKASEANLKFVDFIFPFLSFD